MRKCDECPLYLPETSLLMCDHCPDMLRCQRCAINHAKQLDLHHKHVPDMLRRKS